MYFLIKLGLFLAFGIPALILLVLLFLAALPILIPLAILVTIAVLGDPGIAVFFGVLIVFAAFLLFLRDLYLNRQKPKSTDLKKYDLEEYNNFETWADPEEYDDLDDLEEWKEEG